MLPRIITRERERSPSRLTIDKDCAAVPGRVFGKVNAIKISAGRFAYAESPAATGSAESRRRPGRAITLEQNQSTIFCESVVLRHGQLSCSSTTHPRWQCKVTQQLGFRNVDNPYVASAPAFKTVSPF